MSNNINKTYVTSQGQLKKNLQLDEGIVPLYILSASKEHPTFKGGSIYPYTQYYNLYICSSGSTDCCGAYTVVASILHETYLEPLVFNGVASVLNVFCNIPSVTLSDYYSSYNCTSLEKSIKRLNEKYKNVVEVVATFLTEKRNEFVLTIKVLNSTEYLRICKEIM